MSETFQTTIDGYVLYPVNVINLGGASYGIRSVKYFKIPLNRVM